MKMNRRAAFAALAGMMAAMTAGGVQAQDFPNRPVKIIVPRAPGGGSDIIARLLSPGMEKQLGQPVIIENRPDATATLGAELVSKSKPDGYNLYLSDNSFYQNPAVLPSLPYDTLKDLSAVTMLAQAPVVLLVNPKVPASNVKELLAYAKANPGKLTYASGGIGASTHLAGVLLNDRAKIDTIHVPYKSSGPALTALLGGEVDMQFGGLASGRQYIESGQIKALAITGDHRLAAMPRIPTFAEEGVAGIDIMSVWGIHAAAGTPLPIRTKLQQAAAAVMKDPTVAKRMNEMGYEPLGNTPEEHQKQTNEIVSLWLDIGKRIKLSE